MTMVMGASAEQKKEPQKQEPQKEEKPGEFARLLFLLRLLLLRLLLLLRGRLLLLSGGLLRSRLRAEVVRGNQQRNQSGNQKEIAKSMLQHDGILSLRDAATKFSWTQSRRGRGRGSP